MRIFQNIAVVGYMLLLANTLSAQSHYPGQHHGKLLLQDKLQPELLSFDLSDVRLLDSRFQQNMLRERQWLLSIDAKRLLHSFRVTAGIFDSNEGGYFEMKKLAGWESLDCDLRGHTTGHILSALALLFASTGDTVFKKKADTLVSGLAEVQRVLNQDGYLSAYPQEMINRNLAGKRVWAPWYTMHKIFAGLIDQYLYCNNTEALDVVTKMGTWAYKKLQLVTAAQRTTMLKNEFGGMNDALYNLYAITGNTDFKWVADFFYHDETLDPLRAGKDILEKKHANTYIPKLIGLTREYELSGKGSSDSIARFFWNTVIDHHSFATGSNSDKEKFFKPDSQSDHLSGYTGESCNVYNMLKLTRHLYLHSPNMKYVDYYERALFNHILGQQDPATGMIAYFLPMLPGAHKVYSTPDSSFWCCVGSGFENQAKYGESIYFYKNDNLFVNLFIASELNWKAKSLQIRQETAFPGNGRLTFTVVTAGDEKMILNVRYPYWTNKAVVTVNGRSQHAVKQPNGYLVISKKWKPGDRVLVSFEMHLHTIPTNDDPKKVAIAYGPIVLAGVMGKEGFSNRQPYSNPMLYNDYYTYNYNVPPGISTSLSLDPLKINEGIKPFGKEPLCFKVEKEGIVLQPLYECTGNGT